MGQSEPGFLLTQICDVSAAAAAAAKLLQLCPTLCDPRDHSPPGSTINEFPNTHWASPIEMTSDLKFKQLVQIPKVKHSWLSPV